MPRFYEISPFAVTKVDIRGSGLVSHISGQPDLLLYPEGGGKFFAKTAEIELTFQTGADGRVSGVVIKQGGQQPLAKRIDAACHANGSRIP